MTSELITNNLRTMTKTIRVLIADDISQVRQGLINVLGLATRNQIPRIEVVGEAQDGNEAIQKTQMLRPDVVLMDLEMPVVDGFSATQRIKSDFPDISVIVLTIHGDQTTRQKAFHAGADIFLEKDAAIAELLQAILQCGRMP